MTLSEAMRLGAALRPHGFGQFERHGRTCAIGAAMEATAFWRTAVWPEGWMALFNQVTTCPHAGCRFDWPVDEARLVWDVIVHLNDHHRWTRERIADWVETVEGTGAAPVSEGTDAVLA